MDNTKSWLVEMAYCEVVNVFPASYFHNNTFSLLAIVVTTYFVMLGVVEYNLQGQTCPLKRKARAGDAGSTL